MVDIGIYTEGERGVEKRSALFLAWPSLPHLSSLQWGIKCFKVHRSRRDTCKNRRGEAVFEGRGWGKGESENRIGGEEGCVMMMSLAG